VSLAGIRLFDVPFPVIVIAAGVCGVWLARVSPQALALDAPPPAHGAHAADDVAALPTSSTRRAWIAACVGLALWLAPVALLVATRAADDPLRGIATLFSRVAVVSFGGAYAVLAYVAQQAVDVKAWLAPGEMLDALALAETTPGPLVLVLQHVGFLAAWRGAGTQSRWIHGALGALIAAWVTFVPSFVWIFAGAPFIEQARRSRSLQGALAAITAAIVGVIASLALWFALHVVFAQVDAVHIGVLHLPWPNPSSIHLGATAISLVALVVALRGGVGTPLLLAGGALCGVAWSALAGG
jgi:chromate transporter